MPATPPDCLVLAAGGILGEAWMSGLLAGVEDAQGVDFRACEWFVGTSAGSIVAAGLAAGQSPRRPRGAARVDGPAPVHEAAAPPAARGGPLRGAGRVAARAGFLASAPFASIALAAGTPAGARLRGIALSRLPDRGRTLDDLREQVRRAGARFDGRLRVCAVDRDSGRRVVFGAPGAPRATVAEAVAASCSIPWVFRPVEIGGRSYVDGGAWSLTNLDVAPVGRDAEVLCLNPSASAGLALSSPMGLLRTAAGLGAELEALALRARGVRVRMVGPDADVARLMGANLMDPRPAAKVLAAGYRQGLRLGR